MKTDEGISPVIAIVVLIGFVIIAGAIISLTMFGTMEDMSGTLPDVRFQVSADGVSLYHAGGDSLPLRNLVFYDTLSKQNMTVQLIKGGANSEIDSVRDHDLFELSVWETGDKIRIIGGNLVALSIVGPDSRNHPALLYMGANAAVLPIGDMVPDEWIETPPTPPTPPVIPPTPPNFGDKNLIDDIFQPSQNSYFDFGSNPKVNLQEKIRLQELNITYPLPGDNTPVELKPQWSKYEWTKVTVTVYNNETGAVVYPTTYQLVEKNDVMTTIRIPHDILKTGYVCHITIEIWKDKNMENLVARQTVVITFI
ncbi:type IV pilin N-terminal domain-containing protein [Methanorbis rubei]|uniref:Archaeal Type IV pilin N-terminal domain-containing protein n=1 Tax=Methanorbis rubei TaxID=3028300 RepID=A0AAE4MET1_9EURY|nr:hypothetical protein [Methanocorpusculaceae archaeon Cs1]